MWLIKLGFLPATSFSKAKVFVCWSTSNEWTHTIEPYIIILSGSHTTILLPSLWRNANVLINNSLTPGKWKLAIGRTCFFSCIKMVRLIHAAFWWFFLFFFNERAFDDLVKRKIDKSWAFEIWLHFLRRHGSFIHVKGFALLGIGYCELAPSSQVNHN